MVYCYGNNNAPSPQTGQHCPGGTIVSTPGAQLGRGHVTACENQMCNLMLIFFLQLFMIVIIHREQQSLLHCNTQQHNNY